MKVIVKNKEFERNNIWFFKQPEFFEYEGQEVKVKWAKPDELALTTGNPEFPIRIIQRSRIVSIDGDAVAAKQQKTSFATKVVKGTKGQEYVVTNSNGQWSCTCPGFQFRRTCKHVNQ